MTDIDEGLLRKFLWDRATEDFGQVVSGKVEDESGHLLAEAESKLWLLELPPESVSVDVLTMLAYVYENHSEFDEAWARPEPRRPLDWAALNARRRGQPPV